MNKLFTVLFILCFCCTSMLMAQDPANGFASVSGKGLETTTGGAGGSVVYVSSIGNLKIYAASPEPYIIVVEGLIESANFSQVDVNSNKTIVGAGNDATLKNIELNITNRQNVIIRNLIIRDSYVEGDEAGKENDNDAVQVDNSHHIWIDHCHFTHCGDGLIDLRLASDFITVSWTHLSNHNKAFGIGWTEDPNWTVTIHHCWIDSTSQRNPSFGQGVGHLYNNYLHKIGSYGNYARGLANVVVENSFFYNVNDPLKYDTDSKLYAAGNIFKSCTGNKSSNVTTMPFNPATFYDYELDATEDVRGLLISGTGPQSYIASQYTGANVEKGYFSATAPEGNGTITVDTAGVEPGGQISVTAVPDEGYEFAGWNVYQMSEVNPLALIATDSINLTASFSPAYYLITTGVAEGEGAVDPKTGSRQYDESITVTATPAEGWVFDHWEGDLSGSTNPETVVVNGAMNISAYFTQVSSAVKSVDADELATFYVNQNERMLYLSCSVEGKLDVAIYSLNGQLMYDGNFDQAQSIEIPLSGFNSGMYVVRINTEHVVQTGQFIVY